MRRFCKLGCALLQVRATFRGEGADGWEGSQIHPCTCTRPRASPLTILTLTSPLVPSPVAAAKLSVLPHKPPKIATEAIMATTALEFTTTTLGDDAPEAAAFKALDKITQITNATADALQDLVVL